LSFEQEFYAKGFPIGYNVGILFKPVKQLSLGISMRSGSDVTLEGPSDIIVHLVNPLAIYIDSDLNIKYKLPYLVVGGVAFRPLPDLVLVADVQYNGWGRLSDIRLTFEKLNFTVVQKTGYEDTVKFMVGGEYTFLTHYSVRLGYMYTPNSIKHEEVLSYQSWDTDMHNFSFGIGYSWTRLSVYGVAMVSPGKWNVKHFDDPHDPIGKPGGEYTTFNQTYGIGCLWYF
jgi:long-subunit fatty acid transport protein